MKILLASILTAGLAMSGGSALAQESVTGDLSFTGVDTDHDGFVSWPEFELVFEDDINEEQFKTADLDGDGLLSASEYDNLALSTGSIGMGGGASESLSEPVAPESLSAE